MESGEAADDLQMTEFFSPDVHEHIFSGAIVTVQALDGILHCSSQLAVSPSELLQKHIAKTWVRGVYPNGVHKFFHVMIHRELLTWFTRELRPLLMVPTLEAIIQIFFSGKLKPRWNW
jgi:hypothetical protein